MLPISETIIQGQKAAPIRGLAVLVLVFLNAIILKIAFVYNTQWYPTLLITLPLLGAAIFFKKQRTPKEAPKPPATIAKINVVNAEPAGLVQDQNSITLAT